MGVNIYLSRCTLCGGIYGCNEYVGDQWQTKKCVICDARYVCAYRVIGVIDQDARDIRDCAQCVERENCTHMGHQIKRVCAACPRRMDCKAFHGISLVHISDYDISHGYCCQRCGIIEYPDIFSTDEVVNALKQDGFPSHVICRIKDKFTSLDATMSVKRNNAHYVHMRREILLTIAKMDWLLI